MRAKKAKALRKQAREMTKGMPERRLLAKKHIVDYKGRKYTQRQAFNDPDTTRGVYRALKKAAK